MAPAIGRVPIGPGGCRRCAVASTGRPGGHGPWTVRGRRRTCDAPHHVGGVERGHHLGADEQGADGDAGSGVEQVVRRSVLEVRPHEDSTTGATRPSQRRPHASGCRRPRSGSTGGRKIPELPGRPSSARADDRRPCRRCTRRSMPLWRTSVRPGSPRHGTNRRGRSSETQMNRSVNVRRCGRPPGCRCRPGREVAHHRRPGGPGWPRPGSGIEPAQVDRRRLGAAPTRTAGPRGSPGGVRRGPRRRGPGTRRTSPERLVGVGGSDHA